jgi:hypothetical protein
MARKRIDELTERTDFDATCELPLHDGVQTWKATAPKMQTYMQTVPVSAKTTSYAVAATDFLLTMDATAGTRTFTLPTAVGKTGKVYVLKKIDSSSNAVQILTTSAQTLDGSASGALYLKLQWDTIKVVSNGANWLILDMNFGIAGGNFIVSY